PPPSLAAAFRCRLRASFLLACVRESSRRSAALSTSVRPSPAAALRTSSRNRSRGASPAVRRLPPSRPRFRYTERNTPRTEGRSKAAKEEPMRFISWNVNGLRAVLKKGFEDIVCDFDADIVALQETKLQEGQATLDLPQYREYWSYAERKGYSGTAVFCKEQPLQALHGLGSDHLDTEGRVVALEFPGFWFVDVYTPNAQNELARIDHRMEWDD